MTAPYVPTVLIIEDDDDSRLLLATLLTCHGYRVRAACNGAEGLQNAHDSIPDCILLDLNMPVMDGPTFRIHQLADVSLASVPVICVSALAPSSREARSLGAVDFVQKPYDFDQLLHLIEMVGRHYQWQGVETAQPEMTHSATLVAITSLSPPDHLLSHGELHRARRRTGGHSRLIQNR